MKTKIDVRLTRSQVEQLFKVLVENPDSPSVTIGCTVDLAEIKFSDSYTELVSGTEICSTTASMRCK